MRKLIVILLTACTISCSKEEFLGKKPDDSLVVPVTLADFEAILDNDVVMNGKGTFGAGAVPIIGETAADNYFVRDTDFPNFQIQLQHIYTWNKNVFDGSTLFDWDYLYRMVFYSNLVMQGLDNLPPEQHNTEQFRQVYGRALFFRSHSFYQLAQVFAPHYDPASASSLLGVPLRLEAGFEETITRANLSETYDRCLRDLKSAVNYLNMDNEIKTRPSKQAVYALLSRVYLTMGEYPMSQLYADSCLQINSQLLDYANVDATLRYPFPLPENNPEVIFSCTMTDIINGPLWINRERTDTLLYRSYAESDYRKNAFFREVAGGYNFKGTYEGNNYLFAGIAIDEIFLNRAESKVRTGDIAGGMQDLVHLLRHRLTRDAPILDTYLALTDQQQAVDIILQERRKQLLHRGLRWTDLRRLNHEGRDITIYRKINGTTYSLPPGDPRWVFPIPQYVRDFNPDMPQNER